MGTIDLCFKLFGKRDLYELLEIEKDAEQKDIKKAYYKLSLLVHPDRVKEEEKEAATEKFKLISKVYQVLSDKDSRAIYDEHGTIDDDDDEVSSKLNSWLDLWKKIFQPLTTEDITNYERTYIGSELEKTDIKKSYLSSKGDINIMMTEVPFLKVEDEPRLHKIVDKMIAANEVPEYKMFTEENAAKRKRRHQKYARESKEAQKIKKYLLKKDDAGDLTKALMQRREARQDNFEEMIDKIKGRYGSGQDDSDSIDIATLGKKQRRGGNKRQTRQTEEETMHSVKNGRVTKRKTAKNQK